MIRAIEYECPDRIPITNSAVPAGLIKYGEKLERIFREYPSDFGPRYAPSTYPQQAFFLHRKKRYLDEWGCEWLMLKHGILGQVKGHPLADLKALETYQFPEPSKPEKGYIIGNGGNLFERMQWLRGFEDLMVDLITKRKEAYTIRDKILEYNLEMIKVSLESDVDGISFADDLGTQNKLMINPSLWMGFFKPAYKQMFDEVHRAGKHVLFHSDGYIIDIIPDLIEIGVNVLWEAEIQNNNIDALGENFGGKLCFAGNMDTQRILPFGNAEDIKKHVIHAIQALGSYDGGFIGVGEIHTDVPLRNVKAMYKAFTKYGKYPLTRI